MNTATIIHDAPCEWDLAERAPQLLIQFDASIDASTIKVTIWERCGGCEATVTYAAQRMPWRRIHRDRRASVAVWFATWEHRYQLSGTSNPL